MKLDEHFSNALKQAVINEPPVVDARTRFEARLARTRRMRIAMSSAGLVAAAIVAVLVVPRVLPEPAKTPVVPATQEPTTGIDTSRWTTVTGEGWRAKMPPTWKRQMFEGDVELVPPGLTGTAVGEPTFVLIFRPEADAYDQVRLPDGGETSDGTWSDGRKYRRWQSSDLSKPRIEVVFESAYAPFRSLHVMFHGDTRLLWDEYVREALATYESLVFER